MNLAWWICDGARHPGKGFCLYEDWIVESKMFIRCIKHGDILVPAPSVNGLSRKEARKKIETADKEVVS